MIKTAPPIFTRSQWPLMWQEGPSHSPNVPNCKGEEPDGFS